MPQDAPKFLKVCSVERKPIRRVHGSLKLTPQRHERVLIIKLCHEDTGHWETKATLTLTSGQFWWLSIFKEVCVYVKTGKDSQSMCILPQYSFQLKDPLNRLFDTFSVEFAAFFRRPLAG